MEKHVVVIFPHPDDESFGAAGTITAFREQGVPVTYLCGTLGEMGRNMGSPPFANRETLPVIRKEELINACEKLDINLRMLGYRDKTMEFEDKREVANHLKRHLDELQPSLVITHFPEHAVHPDHNAMGAAAIEAIRLMEPENRPVVWAHAITNNYIEELGQPDIHNDVSPYFEQKMEAVLAHKSQASGILGKFQESASLSADVMEAAKERLGVEQFYVWKFSK
ncbi:bacillithiol biosynthesis deacetylase BshB2 [Lentibacillus cibarius]|uniref:Bacillithiol biosynthesis deacetylase BshB2 n=1 Tax=Lentibacillus cibarius TaxID=2583219 RepID=A0A5S3QQ29_9BACI|nr:bacillithiol biosynthesis deacetylase BshB2 [Lentibacillus cibarius]TMN23778.1 bacillithiol biosynthesis deacetylase BshB2 [Lentibacillus cibarius]